MIKMIFACDKSTRCIGKDGNLPWRLSKDLKFFKETTDQHVVICGRKTYESLPKLPNRRCIVITHEQNFCGNDRNPLFKKFNSIEDFLEFYKNFNEDVFVIGGATIYNLFEDYADELIIDEIVQCNGNSYIGDSYVFDYHEKFCCFEIIDVTYCIDKKEGDYKDTEVYLNFSIWKRKNF